MVVMCYNITYSKEILYYIKKKKDLKAVLKFINYF